MECQNTSLDGQRCRFHLGHEGECEIGGHLSMPYSLEKWNETLRWRMQRGYEVELQDIKDGACSHRRFDGRQCDAKPGHGPWHAFDDMCELCDFKISAPSFAPGQECPNCGGVGRSRPWGVKSEARRMKERHERFGKHFGYQ